MILHIATIVNRMPTYQEMRASMQAVGYTEDRCRFTIFDNTAGNHYEPFEVLRSHLRDGPEPYVMLCHQDLLFTPEASLDLLIQRLEQLTARDPRWAVAGNAGANTRGRLVLHLDDPYGSSRVAGLPQRVMTLDENLLILRRDHYVATTPGLSGFHLYGADLCLNALMQRKTAYVIDCPIRHLSPGDFSGTGFSSARENMMAAWRRRLIIGMVRTPSGYFSVSRWRWLESLLSFRYVATALRMLRLSLLPARYAQDRRPERVGGVHA